MKKGYSILIGLIGFFAAIFVASCRPDDETIDCKNGNAVKQTIVVGGGDSTITIYPVITPANHPSCDSMAYDPRRGAYVYPYMVHPYMVQEPCSPQQARDSLRVGNDTACPCRENPDTVFNDEKNGYFHIGNIGKFPYNRLIVKTEKDSTKMRTYTDYDNKNNLFIAEVAMDTTLGYYDNNNTKALRAGIYTYYLILYKDEQHYIQIGDTIEGQFAVIRTSRDQNKNCKNEARDQDDPLLK